MKWLDVVTESMKVLSLVGDAAKLGRVKVPSSPVVKGAVLMHSVKGAAVLGFERGHGLLFKVLSEDVDGGPPQLSPPVIVQLSKVAVGLQLGYSSVYSLMLVDSSEQLELMASKSEVVLGRDLEFSGVPSASRNPAEATVHSSSMQTVNSYTGSRSIPTVISVSDSVMVCDFSLYGGSLSVDRATMDDAYGKDVVPVDVLYGNVRPPEAMQKVSVAVAEKLHRVLHDA